MGMVEGPLRELGAYCETNGGLPPVKVKGPMKGGDITIDGSTTSQFITGLLMTLPLCARDSILRVENLQSRPYVELTTKILKRFGVTVGGDLEEGVLEIPGNQEYTPVEITMPGDWSGAAFMLVAGAIAGRTTVKGLSIRSSQADRDILLALEMAGAKVDVSGSTISVHSPGELTNFDFDATHCPDLFPPLAILALNCEGESRIHGAHLLSVKESDRGIILAQEFTRLGGDITVEGEDLVINGSRLEGGKGDSHGDHRIAMALAVAALTSAEGVQIMDYDVVTKSYPNFFRDLESLMVV
jgi:3-phosphoshikimate 1-carboxyvinyltransferase